MKRLSHIFRPILPSRLHGRRLGLVGLLLGIVVGLSACGGGLGKELERSFVPPEDPTLQAILADLAENDAAWHSFEGRGRAIVETPNLEAIQVLRQSDVMYRKPDALHVIGRRHGTTAFRLTGVNRAFLMEFPTERQYVLETETILSDDYQRISPVDLLHEIFQQEDWGALPRERVHLDTFHEEEDGLWALLDIYAPQGNYPRRRLRLEAAPAWVVRESKLLDPESGTLIAETRLNNYRLLEGVRFPADVATEFPLHESRMEFAFSNITLNRSLDAALFDLEAQHQALRQRGFERVYPEPIE